MPSVTRSPVKIAAGPIAWAAQEGPQRLLVRCPTSEVFFGGRTTVSSADAIERSKELYRPQGGVFNETKLAWRMPNGGRVSFAYLDSVDDAQEYQGRNLTDAWIEEAGQYPTPDPILRLYGALRSSTGVPTQLVLTGNPGGPGQGWIRERYEMVPFPEGAKLLEKKLPDGSSHKVTVIPSRLSDNKILMQKDPSYVQRLMMVGNAKLVSAWLDGDWNAIEGAFFDEWEERRHVVMPFPVPPDWLRFRSMDWGSASPFSVGWWAVCGDDYPLGDPGSGSGTGPGSGSGIDSGSGAGTGPGSGSGTGGRLIPRGALIRYREWYGASEPNKGLKLTAEAVGRGIKERERATTSPMECSIFRHTRNPAAPRSPRWCGASTAIRGRASVLRTTAASASSARPRAGWRCARGSKAMASSRCSSCSRPARRRSARFRCCSTTPTGPKTSTRRWKTMRRTRPAMLACRGPIWRSRSRASRGRGMCSPAIRASSGRSGERADVMKRGDEEITASMTPSPSGRPIVSGARGNRGNRYVSL